MVLAVIAESIAAGAAAVILSAGVVLTRQVYRLSGVVENGLTDKLDHIEERVDKIYDHLIDT